MLVSKRLDRLIARIGMALEEREDADLYAECVIKITTPGLEWWQRSPSIKEWWSHGQLTKSKRDAQTWGDDNKAIAEADRIADDPKYKGEDIVVYMDEDPIYSRIGGEPK